VQRPKVHYAWMILALSFIAIATGASMRFAFGSFVLPWQQSFGVGRSAISGIATFSFVVFGLLQPVMGRWADRRGPGAVLGASMVLVAVGLLITRWAGSFWLLGLGFGVVASMGFAGASTVAGSTAVARWFASRQGLAMAIITLSMSVGQMLFTPAAIFLNATAGWRQTLLYWAIALLALAPLIWWLLKPDPAAMGLEPYGAERLRGTLPPLSGEPPAGGSLAGIGRLVRNANFWFLALPYFICGFTTAGLIDTHFVPFIEDHHLPPAASATAVAVLAIGNSLGILTSGWLTDRIPRRLLLSLLYATRGVCLVLLVAIPNPGALLALSALFGFVDFSTVPPTSSLAAELLGGEGVGLVLGLISLCHQLGAAAGAFVPGLLHDLTGNYLAAFLLAALTLGAASGLSLWVREGRRPPADLRPIAAEA